MLLQPLLAKEDRVVIHASVGSQVLGLEVSEHLRWAVELLIGSVCGQRL